MGERARGPRDGEDEGELAGSHPRPIGGEPGMEETLRASPGTGGGWLEAGALLEGTYRVVDLLGQGAMGAVYLVEHVALGKRFAAKVVSGSARMDAAAVARLRNEARMASAIDHDHIVDVMHLGVTHDGNVFVVMELLRGEDLRARTLARRQRAARGEGDPWLDDTEVRAIVSPILHALEAAHAAGIVHRDLKPENVFLHERHGKIVPKIVDFGIGKLRSPEGGDLRLTATGQIVGTPLYMAPEQSRSTTLVDHRADIYALGVLLFELLTGRLPFESTHLYEIVVKHVTEPPPDPRSLRPGLPEPVAAVVLRCLEKSPDERFQSASELLAAWEAAWGGTGVPVLPASHASTSASGPRSIPPGPTASSAAATAALTSRAGAPTDPEAQASSEPRPEPAPRRPVQPLAVAAGVAALAIVAALSWWMGSTSSRGAGDAPPPPAPSLAESASPSSEREPERREVVVTPVPEVEPPVAAEPTVIRRRIVSEPAGAEVLRDGISVGVTPLDVELSEGEVVTIELRRRGHRSVTQQIDEASPETIELRLPRRSGAPAYPELAPR